MKKLLVILGPTSTGKTDLALNLAKKFNGELVACDSRQVYKGLDIGTGKLPGQEVVIKKGEGFWIMDGVKVWMYDVADPKRQYTVYHYVKDARKAVEDIAERGKLPIIVGGTGLYLKALLSGLSNLSIKPDLKLRKELENLSLNKLQEKIQKSCMKRWEKMNDSDRQNSRRLIRVLEIGNSKEVKSISGLKKDFEILKIGLNAPRKVLYKRIDERVIKRIEQGIIEEAKYLHEKGLSFKRMKQLGLEYGVLVDYMEGKIKSREELVKILQGEIHGSARRQETWFKKEKNVLSFDITAKDFFLKLESKINSWYYQTNDKKN